MVIDESVVQKLLEVVDAGLCRGKGSPIPGHMCIEAAVCYALGEDHGDNPSCVSPAVRRFKIRLNDAGWSSYTARANGLRKIAVAQLGSKGVVNDHRFAGLVTLRVAREIVADVLDAVGVDSTAIRIASTTPELYTAAKAAAKAAADAAAYAAADAAACAARAAACAAADAAASAADAAADAAYAAADAAACAARAAACAAADAAASAADAVLCRAADICLDALRECGSPGCQFLYLCD